MTNYLLGIIFIEFTNDFNIHLIYQKLIMIDKAGDNVITEVPD